MITRIIPNIPTNNPQMAEVNKLISKLEFIARNGYTDCSNTSVPARLQNADTILRKLQELRFLYQGGININYGSNDPNNYN